MIALSEIQKALGLIANKDSLKHSLPPCFGNLHQLTIDYNMVIVEPVKTIVLKKNLSLAGKYLNRIGKSGIGAPGFRVWFHAHVSECKITAKLTNETQSVPGKNIKMLEAYFLTTINYCPGLLANGISTLKKNPIPG